MDSDQNQKFTFFRLCVILILSEKNTIFAAVKLKPIIMKKVMAIFGAALLLAGVATSCNKKCECKTYVAGVVTTTTEMELDKGKKCSDYTTIITEDPKTGYECKSKLF